MIDREKDAGSRDFRDWIQRIVVSESEKVDCGILESDLFETEVSEGCRFYWHKGSSGDCGSGVLEEGEGKLFGNGKLIDLRSQGVDIMEIRLKRK